MFDSFVDPSTGKPYDMGPNTGQWNFDNAGMAGISPEMASALGYTPTPINWGGVDSSGYTQPDINDFYKFLEPQGLKLGQRGGPDGKYYQQLFDASGNPVGQQYSLAQNEDPGNLLGLAWAAMGGGFGAASALGAGATGAGLGDAAGAGLAEGGGGLAGTGLPEYAAYTGGSPYALAGDVAAAPEGAFAGGSGAAADAAGMSLSEGAYPAGLGGSAGGAMSSIGNGLSSAADWMKQNPGLTNIGGSLLNAGIGAYTANNALNAQKDATNQANALWAPYHDLGNAGVAGYKNLLQNPGSITSDPGYAFGLQQGQQAVDRSAASKGGLYSGATLKALERYGTNYAGTKLGEAFNRFGGAAQIGATGTAPMSNNLTGLGNASAGASMYLGNTMQNGVNNALGNFNFQNGGYNPFNSSTYGRSTIPGH